MRRAERLYVGNGSSASLAAADRHDRHSRCMAHAHAHPSALLRRIRSSAMAVIVASVPAVASAQNSPATAPSDSEPPVRDPRPFAALSNTAMSMRDSVVFLARAQIGARYKFGGTTPTR